MSQEIFAINEKIKEKKHLYRSYYPVSKDSHCLSEVFNVTNSYTNGYARGIVFR